MISLSDQIAYLEQECKLLEQSHCRLEVEFGEKGLKQLDPFFIRQLQMLQAIIISLKNYQQRLTHA